MADLERLGFAVIGFMVAMIWRLDQTERARWVVLSGSSHATQRAAWDALRPAPRWARR
jgi:hypothetical protein